MRKMLFACLCLAMLFGLCACGSTSEQVATESAPAETTEAAADVAEDQAAGGNVDEVVVNQVESGIYSEEDINAAIDVIEADFAANFDNCTLKEIGYAGDDALKDYEDYKDQYDADEVIVLTSAFDVGESTGSLEPNSTYEEWNWILVRKDGGNWEHVDHGY